MQKVLIRVLMVGQGKNALSFLNSRPSQKVEESYKIFFLEKVKARA